MKLVFKIADLKSFLERHLRFGIREVRRLPGRSASLNFEAVRREDGFRFVVKCLHVSRTKLQERLARLDIDLAGARFPAHRLFQDDEGEFSGFRILYYEYCTGTELSVSEMSGGWVAQFVEDYHQLSKELQRVSSPANSNPLSMWYEIASNGLKGIGAPFVMRQVRAIVRADEIDYENPPSQIVHGDFHAGNLFFERGRLSRVIDLEGVSRGYPTEDMVRFFTCAIEHCGLLAWRRRAKLLAAFSEVIRIFGCSQREWMVALNSIILNRVATRGYFKGIGLFGAIRELRKIELYAKMKELVQA